MNITRKLLLVAILGFVVASFTSCLVRRSPDRKWRSTHNRTYHYKHNSGRKLWVRDHSRY